MKTLLLDVDGVLGDFVSRVIRALRERGHTYKLADFPTWQILDVLTDEQRKIAVDAILGEGFVRTIEPFAEAQLFVERVRSRVDVVFVTSPWHTSKTWAHERHAWLKEHFAAGDGQIIQTSAKRHVQGDLLVDDKVSTVIEWAARHAKSRAVVWDTPHNRLDLCEGANVVRAPADPAAGWALVEGLLGI